MASTGYRAHCNFPSHNGWIYLQVGASCEKVMHLWQLPWHLPSALKPDSISHLYFSSPLPFGSSHLMRLVIVRGNHDKPGQIPETQLRLWWAKSFSDWKVATWATWVQAGCYCKPGYRMFSRTWGPSYLAAPPNTLCPWETFRIHVAQPAVTQKNLPVHSCDYLATSRKANFSISSLPLKF